MFNFLKNWFAKDGDTTVMEAPEHYATESAEPAAPSTKPTQPDVRLQPRHQTPAKDSVRVSLKSVLAQLPPELRARISQSTEVIEIEAMISVPIETVVPQLSTGSVKISFGELRKISPHGTFSRLADRDGVLVSLPLAEIFPQIDPSLLQRRAAQRQEVPEEISGPFDNKGRGIVISHDTTPKATSVVAPPRINVPTPKSIKPAELIRFNPPTDHAPVFRGFTPQPIGVEQAPAIQPAVGNHTVSPKLDESVMALSLAELAGSWPDAIRTEIVQSNMMAAKVVLPEKLIEQGLKVGKVAFTWRELRSWIQPTRLSGISVNDGIVLELPLKAIAPLFLAKQNASRSNKKAVDENVEAIPSLFYTSMPQPQPHPQPQPPQEALVENKLEDTNYYVWKDTDDAPDENDVTQRAGKAINAKIPDTAFLRRYATPNEIVSKAAALDGVAGAIIALPDGLLVASRIPSDLNADTLAAFLPQIFGRVSQSTKELRMGDLNNLNFTVGNTPWKIFRVGSIFFAAFGRTAEPLPTAQLAGLAAELDRKPK